MYVRMTQTLSGHPAPKRKGFIYEVDEIEGEELVRRNVAEETDTPPPHIAAVLDRLDQGAGEPVLFLPFVGEFGHLIMSHVRMVHFHRAARKVVCCRPGEEVLFPSADECFTDWIDPIRDKDRVGTLRDRAIPWPNIEARFPDHLPWRAGGLTLEQELFCINPDQRITFKPKLRGLRADVVLAPRARAFAPEKNWTGFEAVAQAITAAGYTFATVGGADTAQDLPGQVYHTRGDCDAAIELMQNCRLYIGTDSGASHLASTVGCPMLVFREPANGMRDFVPRMQRINPGRVDYLRGPEPWNDSQIVIARALDHLEHGFAAEPPSRHYVAQHGEDRWLARNWSRLGLPDQGTFVEVGAGDGRHLSNTWWLANEKHWTGLLVEPDPRQTARLKANRPESNVETCAAGSATGTARFGLTPCPEHSGLLRDAPQQIDVQVQTLTTLLHRNDIDHIDVLSIDTEGTELDVWAGLDLERWRPRLVIIEWDTVGLPSNRLAILDRLFHDGYQLAAELGGNLIFTPQEGCQ